MKICADNHTEICFDSGILCPLCAARDELMVALDDREDWKDRAIYAERQLDKHHGIPGRD